MEWTQHINTSIAGGLCLLIGLLYIFFPKHLIKMAQSKKRLHLILNRRPRLIIGFSLVIIGLLSFIYPLFLET